MTLPGTAFLALWNDRAASRGDYEAWHTREHLPERLSIPGILAAQRYVDGEGPLPDYFTLYPLADLDVLHSPEYLAVVDRPTAWSQSMRPTMSRFYRRGCTTELSLGGGLGGCLAAMLLGSERAGNKEVFEAIADLPAFSALHLGHVVDVPALPFAGNGPSDLPGADAILLVESYDHATLGMALALLDPLIARAGYRTLLPWTRYRLAYALDREECATLLPVDADRLRQGTAPRGAPA